MQTHSFNTLIAEELGVHKAILLQYIDFWVQKNHANEICIFEGNAWVYHTSKGFAKIFPYMKENTIALYLRQLEEDGYILSHTCDKIEPEKNRSNRTKYYTLTKKYYCLKNAEKIEKIEEIEPTKPKNSQSSFFPNEPSFFPNEPSFFPNVYKKLNNNLNKKLNKKTLTRARESESVFKFSQKQKKKHADFLESETKNKNANFSENKQPSTNKDLHNLKENTRQSEPEAIHKKHNQRYEDNDSHNGKSTTNAQNVQQIPHNQPNAQSATHKNTESEFNQIWQEYPRKVSKQNALRIYRKHAKNYERILSSIRAHKKTQWLNTSEQYIPHLSTFLNQQRYLDELQTTNASDSAKSTTLRELKALLGG